MKNAAIFDLDGTLINTPQGIVETFIATLRLMKFNVADASAIRATIGLPLEKAFSKLMEIELPDERVGNAVKNYQSLFRDIVLPKAKSLIYPGVEQGLHRLKEDGFLLAIATSKVFKSAEALVKASGLWEYFDFVVGADQVTLPKPHPEMGFLVMNTLGVSSQHAVMVGDTTHDLFMARDAGMRSIAVTYGIHDLVTLQQFPPAH